MKDIFSENTNFNIYINKPVFIIKFDDTKDKNTSNFPQKSKECELITNNNNLEKNTNLIFSINNNIDKTCPYCHSTFQSKYNMERHVRTVHEKLSLTKCEFCGLLFNNISIHSKNCNSNNNKLGNPINNNLLLGKKTKNKSINSKKKSDTNVTKKTECLLNTLTYGSENSGMIHQKVFHNDVNITYNDSKFVEKNESQNKNDSIDLLNSWEYEANKMKLFTILKNNQYLPIKNYFFFKNLVLGNGKYGTVWFCINSNNSTPVAIKRPNNSECQESIDNEIKVIKSLEKYEIFSKVIDQFNFHNIRYLVETLQGPSLDKLIKFCSNKLTIKTIYRIGIDLIKCLKCIHEEGFIYTDLKADNMALLFERKKFYNDIISITLLDFGFAKKYTDINGIHKSPNKSPKTHGNIYLASINSLTGNAISRRDDIISLSYFLFDLYLIVLPWSNTDKNKKNINQTLNLKKSFFPENLCGNSIKEIIAIYNDAIKLEFYESPKYDIYINLLNNKIMGKNRSANEPFRFDWEKKIENIIKLNNGVDNTIKNNKEIQDLFIGYPQEVVINFLKNYIHM